MLGCSVAVKLSENSDITRRQQLPSSPVRVGDVGGGWKLLDKWGSEVLLATWTLTAVLYTRLGVQEVWPLVRNEQDCCRIMRLSVKPFALYGTAAGMSAIAAGLVVKELYKKHKKHRKNK
jgi:hypothetical protein